MRKVLTGLLTASFLGLASPGMAQGVYNWTGFYVGAHAGYGWGTDGGLAFTDYPPGAFAPAFGPGEVPRFLGANPDGFVGGGHLGYNWQFSPGWLLGIEADLSAADISGTASYHYPGPLVAPATTTVSQSLEWLATVRGRVGATVDRLLVYATGGLAFGEVKSAFFIEAPLLLSTLSGSSSDIRFGWTIGAGAEYNFAGNWSARLQWLYYDLGDVSATGPQVTAGVVLPFGLITTAETRGHIATLGISYRFGSGGVPR
jgi:outer membrane immunogenic protein